MTVLAGSRRALWCSNAVHPYRGIAICESEVYPQGAQVTDVTMYLVTSVTICNKELARLRWRQRQAERSIQCESPTY